MVTVTGRKYRTVTDVHTHSMLQINLLRQRVRLKPRKCLPTTTDGWAGVLISHYMIEACDDPGLHRWMLVGKMFDGDTIEFTVHNLVPGRD